MSRPSTHRFQSGWRLWVGRFLLTFLASSFWLGVGEGAEPLAALAESMEAQLGPLGFPREKRAFTPHVTVARIKARPPEDLFDRLERDGERPRRRSAVLSRPGAFWRNAGLVVASTGPGSTVAGFAQTNPQ